MFTDTERQQVNLILETIKVGSLAGLGHMVLADLAACAQTVMFGSSVEDQAAWKEAQRLMRVVAEHRVKNNA